MAKAEQMGAEAADLIFQATLYSRQNWESLRFELKLSKCITESEFWTTFWEQIPAKEVEEGEARKLLNQFGQGLRRRFLLIAKEFPNGLSGEYSGFVKPESACLALNSRWEKMCDIFANWPELLEKFPISGWISSKVATQLKLTMAYDGAEICDMSVDLLLNLVPDNACSSDVADKLAELCRDLTSLEEEKSIRVRMSEFVFHSKNDGWNCAKNLLKTGAKPDDQYLPFAPPSFVLHHSYQEPGLALILEYGNCQVPHPDVVAGWILDASPDPIATRVAALHCLLANPMVRVFVGNRIFGSWLAELDGNSPYLVGFTVQEKNQLFVMFKTEPIWVSQDEVEQEECGPDLKKGNEALVAILDWWRKNKVGHLTDFYREFWPDGVPREFSSTTQNRSSWMTLFALGLMQRHGRVRDFQNRGFIDKMQSKRFWDVFTTIDPRKDGQAWIDVLTAYGDLQDEDEEYGMWMDNFPRLYRVARWYDVYTQVFLGLDYRSKTETAGMLAPNTDSVMSGSGQNAPSVQRSLKLGQHVVARELLRCNVIAGETARSLAFKPGLSVKTFFGMIGFDQLDGDDVGSHHIYRVLCEELGDDDATFDGDYDIPLIIMARDRDLQRIVLGASVVSEGGSYDIK